MPMNGIIGMLRILHDTPLSPEQRESIDVAAASADTLLDLLNNILDLSKIEAGMLQLDLHEIAVTDVCEASLRFVREAAQRKQITLAASYRNATNQITADPRRLKQVLVNLLTNAVKFTPERGRIVLEVTESGSTLSLSVQDNGIGIDAENLPKLFRSFQQIDSALNRKYAGTGLGLALVKRMTEMHGGQVSVTSAPGRGSRFTISLPLRTAIPLASAAPAAGTASPHQPRAYPGEPLILIAEDNPTNRLLLENFLRPRGCRLIFAENGREALARASADRPALILMDVQMPEIDGLEATRRLRANPDLALARIPVIALTALAMPEDRIRCLEAGANGYLSKPLKLSELDRLITELLTQAAPAAADHASIASL